jgi:hypothetical protein
VEHTQMHPALKTDTKNFHYTSKTCGIFSDLNFAWNKNPNGRYEGPSYSKFRKNKIWKKVKSPTFMRNRSWNTSRCRGKLQKMGVLYTHSPKMLGNSSKVSNFIFFKTKKYGRTDRAEGPCRGWRAMAGCRPASGPWSLVACQLVTNGQELVGRCWLAPSLASCLQFFQHVVNPLSLVPTHARPIQTSP